MLSEGKNKLLSYVVVKEDDCKTYSNRSWRPIEYPATHRRSDMDSQEFFG
jgi:hypothetical protein